jgi:hypothetical protein
LSACKSSPTNENASTTNNTSIFNNWLLRQTSGGITGTTISIPEGTKMVLSVGMDSIYREYRNDTLVFQDGFTIRPAVSIFSADSLPVIDFNTSKRFNFVVLHLMNDTLVLAENIYDGYNYLYTRIKQ